MSFRIKSWDPTAMPETQERAYASGSTFTRGALLVVNGSEEFAEAGSDPATVSAVALHPVGTGSGPLFPSGSKEFPPGKALAVVIKPGLKFTAKYVGTPGLGSFGVAKNANGEWVVDFTDTSNTAVVVTSIEWTEDPLEESRVECVFESDVIGQI